MDIPNPRRILAVAPADSEALLSRVIQDLTGTPPTPAAPAQDPTTTTTSSSSAAAAPSLAGTTHILPLTTPYYTTSVPIWLDLAPAPAAAWVAPFLAPEAREVLGALGGVVAVFPLPGAGAGAGGGEEKAAREFVAGVGALLGEGGLGGEWDGVGLVVGVREGGVGPGEAEGVGEEWEGVCDGVRMEFVLVAPGLEERNEFGERTGIPRVLEALQSNDWAQVSTLALEDDTDGLDDADEEFGSFKAAEGTQSAGKVGQDDGDGDDLDPESLDFGFDRADFEGLRQAIWSAGREDGEGEVEEDMTKPSGSTVKTKDGAEEADELNDGEVQKLEQMMRKLQAVRDMGAGLPEEQRKRLAARAVGEVMKEL